MAASGSLLFLGFGSMLLLISSLAACILNLLLWRFRRIKAYAYLSLIPLGALSILHDNWGIWNMNSIQIPLTANQVSFNFHPKAVGDYKLALAFNNNSVNEFNDSCEYSWLDNAKSETECRHSLIYRKVTIDYNDTHYQHQKKFQEVLPFNWSSLAVTNYTGPLLTIKEFKQLPSTPAHVTVKIDATAAEINNAKPRVVMGPSFDYANQWIGDSLFYLLLVLPFLISAIYYFISSRAANK